jgi:hypothetical protein
MFEQDVAAIHTSSDAAQGIPLQRMVKLSTEVKRMPKKGTEACTCP